LVTPRPDHEWLNMAIGRGLPAAILTGGACHVAGKAFSGVRVLVLDRIY